LAAIQELIEYLPKGEKYPRNENYITDLQLASMNSLVPAGLHIECELGLSHSIGYAQGSPYRIPHGITLYIALAGVIKLKAQSVAEAAQIARVSPYVGQCRSGNDETNAHTVGDAIDQLVKALRLESTL